MINDIMVIEVFVMNDKLKIYALQYKILFDVNLFV